MQLGVVPRGAGLAVRDVPEADAADIRDRAQRLAVRGREPAAADERRPRGDDRPPRVVDGRQAANGISAIMYLPAQYRIRWMSESSSSLKLTIWALTRHVRRSKAVFLVRGVGCGIGAIVAATKVVNPRTTATHKPRQRLL